MIVLHVLKEFFATLANHRAVDVDGARELHTSPLSLFDERDEVAFFIWVFFVYVQLERVQRAQYAST